MTNTLLDTMVIRPVRDDEVREMISLWSEAGLPTKPAGRDTLENLRVQLNAAPDLIIGAFDGSRMVGVIMGSDDGRKGWVNRLAVAPDMRRTGVAKTLLNRCEDALRSRGRQIICTLIEEYNEASKELFVSMGYKREDDIIYYTKRDADDV
ncbi:MAG: GNAT family N-acetyltransferase [Methanobacteriota archaeon]|nr:MAG: GNAT family N-acetyltransferase [Euryarchaeota archaeon]